MEVIAFSVSVNHVNGSHLDFTFLIPYGLYLLLCFLLKVFINSLYYISILKRDLLLLNILSMIP